MRALFDASDLEAVLATMADYVTLRFGSGDIICGKEGFVVSNVTLAASVVSVAHPLGTVRSVQQPGPVVIAEMAVTYLRQDRAFVTLPCVNVVRFHDVLIADYRVYAAISPVFTPA